MTAANTRLEDNYQREVQPSCWPAYLKLLFKGSEFGCKLFRSEHHGPLYVQKSFYPEGQDCAHVYLLHPPGGVVSGDQLEVSISLENKASVLMTTPGATRLYRARHDAAGVEPLPQKIINKIHVKQSSFAEWLPAETIVYSGASIELRTEVYLDTTSTFCGWEIVSLGLPESNKDFTDGQFYQSFSVFVDDQAMIIDRLSFSAGSPYLQSSCGFQGCPIFGSLIVGPFNDDVLTITPQLVDLFERLERGAQCGVTTIGNFIIIRYLGNCSDQAKKLFIQAWEIVRPLVSGRTAIKPRIWAT